MKSMLLAASLLLASALQAQYYYKDIIGTKESTDLIKNYKNNKVSRVSLTSYDRENTKSEDFFVEQVFSPAARTLKTITKSGVSTASVLTAYFDNDGKVLRTVDSSDASVSTTEYRYTNDGQLASLLISSSDKNNVFKETEEHIWEYNNNKVARMLRIKGGKDTSFVSLKLDDNGNVIEEQSTRKGIKSEPVYYYYNSNNQLTDIVRYHAKAKRLLPEYMFEYSPANQVIQRITVPGTGSNYLIWRYQYDNRGLKIKEAVYDRQKQLTGKIEYQYQFGS